MARPKKQTVDYFPHYCDHGKTMFILEQRYGNDGYSFWFKLLEMLGKYDGHFIDLDNPADWEFLQSKTRLSEDVCREMLDLLAKLEAIDAELWEQKIVWSQNFVNGLLPVYSNRRAQLPSRPNNYTQKPGPDDISICNLQVETLKGSKGSKESTVEEENAAALSEIIKEFNSNLHPITPMEADDLAAWLKEGFEPDVVIWAIKEAVAKNVRNIRYINAILQSKANEGIKTMAGVEAQKRDKKKPAAEQTSKKKPLTPEERKRIAEATAKLKAGLAQKLDMNRGDNP